MADFGIALAVSQAGGGRFTETGLSLGTPHYMSPEQATGTREIDSRSDIYATGGVLYEMLAGDPPFIGPTPQVVLAKILTEEAPSVAAVRKTVPLHVAGAIQRALERLPADRFSTAAEFSRALRGEDGAAAAYADRARGRAKSFSPLAVGGWVASAVLLAWALLGPGASESPAPARVSFTIEAADGAPIRAFDPPRISPDGSTLAFIALDRGQSKLQVRRLDDPQARWLEGTEGARDPFFSADGTRIAFFSEAGLKSVQVESGEVEQIAGAENLGTFQQAAVWLANDWILFSHEDTPDLWALAPGDDEATVLSDHARIEGAEALFVSNELRVSESAAMGVIFGSDGRLQPAIADTGTRTLRPIEAEGLPIGFWDGLIVLVDRDLRLVEVDPQGGTVGDSIVIGGSALARAGVDLGGAVPDTPTGVPTLSSALFVTIDDASQNNRELIWRSRDGGVEPLGLGLGSWELPRLSPDGTRLLAAGEAGATGPRPEPLPQGVIDLRTSVRTPLAQGGEHAWSTTGEFVFFSRDRGISRQRADGSSQPESLMADLPTSPWVTSTSPDGGTLLYYSNNIRALDLASNETRILIDDAGSERNAQLSPDGAYIACSSTGFGREEVYVKAHPALEPRWTISSGGGELPMWSRDGSELYFVSGERLMAVSGVIDGTFQPGRPEELFRGGFVRHQNGDQSYDVSGDGRFLMIREDPAATITVTTGWLEAALGERGG